MCSTVKRYLKRVRASGRDLCTHCYLLSRVEEEDKVIAITGMYPPTVVEFYDNETSISMNAVMIPLCTGWENDTYPEQAIHSIIGLSFVFVLTNSILYLIT